MADVTAYDPVFEAAGNEWNVDPQLLKAMAIQESGGNPRAVSKAGALGVMQIMPETAKALGLTDPTDPVQSIYGAAKYMNEALDKEGTPERALLYYHGGPGWRQNYGSESAGYVPAITAHYKALASGPDQTQQTQPQPAAAAPSGPQGGGPLIIGDSLASKHGLGGIGVVGAQPKAVLDSIAGLPDDQVKGRDVILSGGASNNPAQASLVYDQVKALKDRGANSVTVVGVGDRPDLAGVNDTLAMVTGRAGGRFVPVPTDQLSGDRIHPTPQGYRTLLAAATPKTATDAAPAGAPASAAPTGAGNAMASNDPLSLLPPAPKPTAGGATTAAPDDPLSLLPPAPKPAGAAATTTTPPGKGGIARNIAAGTLEGEAGVANVLSDPYANLIARPVATAGAFLYDLGAKSTGLYNPLTPEQRADLLSDDYMPQPGTRAINAIGDVVGAKPSDVTATTPEERVARSLTAGVAASPLIPGGALAPIIGGGAAVGGEEAARLVPDWAKPGTELAVNLLTGLAIPGVKAGGGPVGRAINAYVDAPGEGIIPRGAAAERVRQRVEEVRGTAVPPPEAGGPQSGVGGPQPAGAQVTPGYEAIHTPEEEAAYRATAEGKKLLEPQIIGERDVNQYIPGETVNNAEREQTAKAARELKELDIRVPEASDLDKEAAQSNNTARTIYAENTAKGPVEIANRNTQRKADIEADKKTVFAPDNVTGPVDHAPIVKKIQEVLNKPENRQNDAVQTVLRPLIARLQEEGGAGKISDPREMWGLRQQIDRWTSKRMQSDDSNLHYAAHELGEVSDVMDKQIEDAAPGYDKMIAKYAEHSRAIDEMTVLQGALKNLRGPGQTMTFNDFQRFMKNVVDSRMTPSTDLNAFKAISPENMQRLWNIRDSLRRTASAKELARAAGSDTMPNIIDALKGIGKMGGTAALHAYVGAHLGPGGNFALQSLTALGKSLNDRRMIRRATQQMQNLLRLSEPLRIPPGQENPLSGAPPTP